ncbi:hypothetical protein LJC53_03645 [Bacteroidales bacterium OttesenSCG-928-C03]|nr:hypothetical protein [Bacteroidales bacterium OttesenSCG-928-C03]MDL2325933.1 hypothetical protein [Bacteroidales bacterium OttesenSCG-928-A14]
MRKNKFIYPLLIAVSFILILVASSCSSTNKSPVKNTKGPGYTHYRATEPKKTTTRQTNTKHYIKKQKSKKPNY